MAYDENLLWSVRIYYVVSDFISIKSRTYVLKICDETLVVERAYVLRRCVTICLGSGVLTKCHTHTADVNRKWCT